MKIIAIVTMRNEYWIRYENGWIDCVTRKYALEIAKELGFKGVY